MILLGGWVPRGEILPGAVAWVISGLIWAAIAVWAVLHARKQNRVR